MKTVNWNDRLTNLAQETIRLSKEHNDDYMEFIMHELDSIPTYHNQVVSMEVQQQFQRFRLEGEDYREWLQNEDITRKRYHEKMIDSICIINRFCETNGLTKFYPGKLDEVNRYKDPDTRYGIAKMAGEYCHDVFKAGTNQIIEKQHENIINKVMNKAEEMETPAENSQKEP